MRKNLKKFGFVLAGTLMVGWLLASPPLAFAEDPLSKACATNPQSSTCSSRTNKNPITGTDGALYKVATIIAIFAGIVAVIIIILSGFRYITSGGDAQKVSSAKNALIGAVVGLILIVLAQTIITLVLKNL